MKTLRLVGKLFGIVLLILGFNSSCKKDKDDNCITCTIDLTAYGYGVLHYTYCEDDRDTWEDEWDSWQELEEYARYMDAHVDYVSCTF
jgi:hypothetical protein